MRVAFDAGPTLASPTGVGRYAAELAGALEARGVGLSRYAVSLGAPQRPDVRRWRVPARAAQEMWMRFGRPFPERLAADCDVLHATNFVAPPMRKIPSIATIHDLSFYRDDVFPGGERLRRLVPWTLDHVTRVIVPSRAIATELAGRHAYPDERITVTHEGVADVFFGARPLSDMALGRMGIPGRFILAAGTLEPRKNVARLLQAWENIRGELSNWRLVLAGPKGWGPALPETDGVMLLGYVGDETLPGLMAAADIFCYPSHYEGFGLPPLEAMAAGTPCVAGRYSAAAEVLGDAATLVEPTDVDALGAALLELGSDETLRRQRSLTGRSHAGSFTWARTAAQTVAAYEEALAAT